MKNLLLFVFGVTLLLPGFLQAGGGGPVRHIVHFKFKDDATPEQIQKVVDEFAALRNKIKVVQSLEYGTNVSPEGLEKGYKHCWVLSFRNEQDRDTYLHHPSHEAFVALAKPLLADVLVVDFIPARPAYVPVPQTIGKEKKPMRTGIPSAWGQQKTG